MTPERLARIERYATRSVVPRQGLYHLGGGTARRALLGFLGRLPEEVLRKVERDISIVIDDGRMAGCAVPGPAVVILSAGMRCSEPSLIGLMSHETAHLLLAHDHGEEAAHGLALSWGFDEILDLKREGRR